MLILVFAAITLITANCLYGQSSGDSQHLINKSIRVGNIERLCYLYVPRKTKDFKSVPLVFVFHGGGGNPKSMDRRLGFTELAESEGFIVAYPEAVARNWNDGRRTSTTRAHRENIDDIGFVKALIEALSAEYPIDKRRIYALGPSNGGIFSHFIGAKLTKYFAAIAPVIGGIAEGLEKGFDPRYPVSVLIIQGTEDKLVPYHGGPVARNRGRIIGTDEAVKIWTKHNRTDTSPVTQDLPDIDKRDGCTVESFLWKNGTGGAEVQLYKLNGGGHTWPGGQQYLPKFVVGNVCQDLDATGVIWRFFKDHPKPPESIIDPDD